MATEPSTTSTLTPDFTPTNIPNIDIINEHLHNTQSLIKSCFIDIKTGRDKSKSITDTEKTCETITPNIIRNSTTIIIQNIELISKQLNRSITHIQSYISNQLNVNVAMCDNGLKIDKVFTLEVMINILRKYATKYVLCKQVICSSIDTVISKKGKANYVLCNVCKSESLIQ